MEMDQPGGKKEGVEKSHPRGKYATIGENQIRWGLQDTKKRYTEGRKWVSM